MYSMPTSFMPYGVGIKSTAKNRTTGTIKIFQSMYLSYPVTFFLSCFIQFTPLFRLVFSLFENFPGGFQILFGLGRPDFLFLVHTFLERQLSLFNDVLNICRLHQIIPGT